MYVCIPDNLTEQTLKTIIHGLIGVAKKNGRGKQYVGHLHNMLRAKHDYHQWSLARRQPSRFLPASLCSPAYIGRSRHPFLCLCTQTISPTSCHLRDPCE